MKLVIYISLIIINVFPIFGQIPKVYFDAFVAFEELDKPEFFLIDSDTMEVFEIIILYKDKPKNNYLKFNYFSIDSNFNITFNDYIKNNCYVFFGVYLEFLRPSYYCYSTNSEYNISNLINKEGDNSGYKINNTIFFKIFKTKAFVKYYFSNSKDWYKYYFPLKDTIQETFYYYEIAKILKREELNNKRLFSKRRVKLYN